MAGTLTTTTDAVALDYPSQATMDIKVRYGSTASMFTVTLLGTQLNIWRATNAGKDAWVVQPGMALTRAGIVELGGWFIDVFAYAHITYRVNEGGKDRIFYRRVNIESDTNAWGSELLVCEAANGGTAGAVYTGSDLVAVKSGSQVVAAIAVGFVQGSTQGVELYAMRTQVGSAFPSATGSATSVFFAGTRRWTWAGSGRQTPVVDLQHNGDAHTAASPHLWVAMGRAQQRAVKLTWSGGKWTGPSSPTLIDSTVVAQDAVAARWDGARFVIAGVDASSTDAVTIWERDSANSKTTTRSTPTHPTGNIRSKAVSYDSVTRDIRVWAVGTSTAVLYFIDYIRATSTWGAWAQFNATALQDYRSWSVRRGSWGSARHDVLWEPGGTSPYSITHVQQALSYAPSLPGWVYPTPPSGSAANVADSLQLNWTFSDADPGDTQSAFALSRQIGSGTVQYYRTSDATWQATEVKNASTISYIVLNPAWGSTADQPHSYRAKVWDTSDTPSGYGPAQVIMPSAPSNPVLSQPVDGTVWTSESMTAVWTVTDQTSYQLRLLKIFDDFSAAASGDVPAGDLGQTYSVISPLSDYSVSGGTLTMNLTSVSGGTKRVRTTAQWASAEAYAEVQVPVTLAGQPILIDVAIGVTTDGYLCGRLAIYPDGHANLYLVRNIAGTTTYIATRSTIFPVGWHTATRWYGLRFRYISNRLEAKAWDATGPEPVIWDLINSAASTDPLPGGVALQAVLSTGNTNTLPVPVKWRQWTRGDTDLAYSSGDQPSTEARSAVIPYSLPDLSAWRLELQTRNSQGLASDIESAAFTVDYIEPPVPTLTVTPLPGAGLMRITVTNPAPTGGQPEYASGDLFRKVAGTADTTAQRIATGLPAGAIVDDQRAVSGVDYLYLQRAFGVNGTRIDSAWT